MSQYAEQCLIEGMEDPEEAKYNTFVDKFKPKKTTDDCYTPENVYNAVLDWVVAEYGIDRDKVVRPFWPGADYRTAEYPEGCTVVDNPPFSILAEIQRFYQKQSIRFFLFAPTLTCITPTPGVTAIVTDADITYANGAVVNTSFRTNLSPQLVARTAPELADAVATANAANSTAAKLPKYKYPDSVISIARLSALARGGIPFSLAAEDVRFVRALDPQKAVHKSIFGGGFLLSPAAAAAAKPAVVWELSEREENIRKTLGGNVDGNCAETDPIADGRLF